MDGGGGSHGLAASARPSCRAGKVQLCRSSNRVTVRLWAALAGGAEYATSDHPSRWRPFSSRVATNPAIASTTAPGARRGR
jgi:hypothetical protein